MEQQRASGTGGQYAPVIGSGPLRSGDSGPLVPEAALGAAIAQVARPEQLTGTGHGVPEFVAGAAQLVQSLAAQFPLARLPQDAVGETVGMAQALVQAGQSLLVMATHEATVRGLPGQSGHSVPDWITTWAPHIDRSEALATARVADTIEASHRFDPLDPTTQAPAVEGPTARDGQEAAEEEAGCGHAPVCLGTLGARVAQGRARVSRANMITRFVQEMTPAAEATSLQAMATLFTDHVEQLGPRELGLAIKEARTHLKKPPEDETDAQKKASRRLFRRIGTLAGLAEWQLLLDDEAEAVLHAALDPLTRPRPSADEHGLRQLDPRTASQRRADALVEILTRAGAIDDADAPTSGAGRIQVTTSLDALAGAVPGGGTDEHGHHLSAGAIRRLACDADLIPVVLGGPSEPLDVGRLKRLYTPGQRQAVYLRDKTCSFPNCTIPPAWCQIHHVLHWVFGGRTDLLNAAALCQRHHTIVHKYGYTATITATDVDWHIPGSPSATGFT